MGNGGYYQFIPHGFCHCFLPLIQRAVSHREIILHTDFTSVNPWAAALHELLQHGSLSKGSALQAQSVPAWVPHRITNPPANLFSIALLSTGPCSSRGFPWCHSLLWASACSDVVSSRGCRWIFAPSLTSTGCRAQLPHHDFHHRLRGNVCSATWSTRTPATTWAFAEMFLLYTLTLFSLPAITYE